MFLVFFFNDTATTEIYTLSLHDAFPISIGHHGDRVALDRVLEGALAVLGDRLAHARDARRVGHREVVAGGDRHLVALLDRKSTRLNSSHANISYAVFCLKKKKKHKVNKI